MNILEECCKIQLKRIVQGLYTFDEHIKYLTETIHKRITDANEIVVCGLSPIGKNCVSYIRNFAKAPIKIFDLRDKASSTFTLKTENTPPPRRTKQTFIICSREEAINYYEMIPHCNSGIISYNELILFDERFGIKDSLLHNRNFIFEAIKSIFLYASKYLGLLNSLSDDFSKELLSRWLLYRLYGDISIMKDIAQEEKPYFDSEIIMLSHHEIFVDAGGYDGDTLQDFIEVSGNVFDKYYFFEPENNVLQKALEKHANDNRIVFLEKGLSNISGTRFFDTECIDVPEMIQSDYGNKEVNVCTLDSLNIRPTFIKMDIEGAECDALDGAEQTIRKYKPTLAICVYHRPNDILDIYTRVKSYGYERFYIRAERNTLDYDVVLYAQ